MNQEYNILIKKLRNFIRKYYINLILKGLILSFSIIISLFLIVTAFEYLTWNSILIRTIIFYVFITVTVFILIGYVVIPLFKLMHIGKTLNFQEAASIIGNHFHGIADKLLNTIQLNRQLDKVGDRRSVELLSASIDQRSSELSPLPFKNAVDLKKNYKYLKYLLLPLLIIIVVLVLFPAFIVEPSNRIVNYKDHYIKPLPYKLIIENNDLSVLQKDDFILKLTAFGNAIPAEIFLDDGQYSHPMNSSAGGRFFYTFKNVNEDIYFRIITADYTSENYLIKVLPKPTIYTFDIRLIYPDYLRKKSDVISNAGDLIVPEATSIEWLINAKDAEKIIFNKDGKENYLATDHENVFRYKTLADKTFWYSLLAENEYVKNLDSLSFNVQVIKDEFPLIEMNQLPEDKQYGLLYINGSISDDYGFHSLKMYYRKESMIESSWNSMDMRIDKNLSKQFFNHTFITQDLDLLPGTDFKYYFEIRDNDEVNGYKRTKTTVYHFHVEGIDEIENKHQNTSEKIKEKIKKVISDLEAIKKEIEKKQNSLFEKKEVNWSDKQQLAELLNKQKDINKQIDELKKLNQEVNRLEELLKRQNDELLDEKIEQLNEMFEELMAEEMKKMEEELDKIDKDKLNEMLKNLEDQNINLKTDLEQNLELYKQLELEKEMQETIDKLNELANDQNQLADKTEEKQLSNEKAIDEQKEINERFSEVKNDLSDLEKLNNELEQPLNIDTQPEIADSIDQELSEANDKLNKGKPKKASQNQKNAGRKMEKMASDIGLMMQSAMLSRMGEDAEQIKKILDNLLDLSFGQEDLMEKVKSTSLNNPKFVDNLSELQLIKDGYLILHDSLIALSKRQIAVQQFIVKESDKINLHINRALLYLQDRKRGQALSDQQYSMTSMNNLALMLSESLDQMQTSMQNAGQKGGQSCPTPGSGKPGSMEEMIRMQQGLNNGMEKGQKENGLNGDQGLNQQSEKLARMAALQSEIRRKLSEYLEQIERSHGSAGDLSRLIDEMKKTEEEIVNKRITKETLERQKQIEVRLLKSERAKLEREKKEQRESNEGINRIRDNSVRNENPLKEQQKKEDLLQTIPIEMTPYFNNLLKMYLYKLETQNGS